MLMMQPPCPCAIIALPASWLQYHVPLSTMLLDDVPTILGERLGGGIETRPGVVHQDVQPSELIQRLLHHRLHRGGVSHVGLRRKNRRAVLPQLCRSGLQPLQVAGRDHQVRPHLGVFRGDGLPQPGTPAGDDGGLVFENVGGKDVVHDVRVNGIRHCAIGSVALWPAGSPRPSGTRSPSGLGAWRCSRGASPVCT